MSRMFYLNYSWHYNDLNSAEVPLSNKQTLKRQPMLNSAVPASRRLIYCHFICAAAEKPDDVKHAIL